MQAQHRNLLTQLGVDVWVPRHITPKNISTTSIWRDQQIKLPEHDALGQEASVAQSQHTTLDHPHQLTAEPNQVSDAALTSLADQSMHASAVEKLKRTLAKAQTDTYKQTDTHKQTSAKAEIDLISHQQEPIRTDVAIATDLTPVQEAKEIHVEFKQEFILEACCFAKQVIMIERQQMSTTHEQLWRNIQAIEENSQVVQLFWPIPQLNLNDEKGMKYYLQGFLDMHVMSKPIIFLGQTDLFSSESMQMAPSLNEMIEQPLLKRTLWKLLCNITTTT